MNALHGVVGCWKPASNEIHVRAGRSRALGCIERMLDFVKAHPDAIAQPRSGFVPNIGVA